MERIKSGARKGRAVVLLPEVVEALRAWRMECGGQGLVFGRDDDRTRPVRPEGDHRAWKDICARAGVPQVPLHGARASTGTRLADLGVPAHIVSAVLGHAHIQVTLDHYIRSSVAQQRVALAGVPRLAPAPE